MGERVKRVNRVLVGGGIGAGKSVVLDALSNLGYETVQADRIGHSLLGPGGDAESLVSERWPSVVKGGEIKRGLLAAIVFDDAGALAELEAITHPLILDEIKARSVAAGDAPFAVEIAIPGLVDADGWFRLAVVAPEQVRVGRAIARGSAEADVLARMANQPTEANWRAWADGVVDNDGTIDDVRRRVRELMGHAGP